MNMSTWWIRRRGCDNLLKSIICNNLTIGSYQAIPTAHASSFSLFHSRLSNSVITRCGTYSISCNLSYAALFMAYRDKSNETVKELLSTEENQCVDFPGGKVAFTSNMKFLPGSSEKRVQFYRVLNEDGYPVSSNMPEHVSKELGLKVYRGMVTLQTMDTLFYEVHRQGRLSLYVPSFGEEAINIASAAALSSDDLILAQYRELGVLLWHGFTPQEFANQLFGKNIGHGKGRNMTSHYGSKKHNYFTISAPIATQLPQAVGVACLFSQNG